MSVEDNDDDDDSVENACLRQIHESSRFMIQGFVLLSVVSDVNRGKSCTGKDCV